MKKIIISISFLFLVSSCEQVLEDEEFPYRRQLIVSGLIEAGQPVTNIFIGVTLPVGYSFDSTLSAVDDAYGAIIYEDSIYVLENIGEGFYERQDLIPEEGKVYKLIVQYRDLSVNAETRIPNFGSVEDVGTLQHRDTADILRYNYQVKVLAKGREAYGATWATLSSNKRVLMEAEEFGTVLSTENDLGGLIQISTTEVPAAIVINDVDVAVRVFAYDEDFYQYFENQVAGQTPDAIFGQPTPRIDWNVNGDGIGIFLGRTSELHDF